MSQFWFIYFIIIMSLLFSNSGNGGKSKLKKNKKKGNVNMSELVKEFVGRRVIIYFNSGISGVTGTITKVDDGWVKVEDEKGKVDLVSIDYISRIQDYPPKNKDKKI